MTRDPRPAPRRRRQPQPRPEQAPMWRLLGPQPRPYDWATDEPEDNQQ